MRTARQERHRTLPAALLAAVAIALALLAAPQALASTPGEQLILRCTHNESLTGFPQSAYTQALSELSADSEEYTGCAILIRQAQLATATGNTAAAGASVPTLIPATPQEQASIAHATHSGSGPVRLGGQLIRPGVVPVSISSAVSTLPTPLLLIVVLLLAFVLVIAAGGVRSHIRSRRTD